MIMLPKQKINHAISANTAQMQRITPQVNRYTNLKWSIKSSHIDQREMNQRFFL